MTWSESRSAPGCIRQNAGRQMQAVARSHRNRAGAPAGIHRDGSKYSRVVICFLVRPLTDQVRNQELLPPCSSVSGSGITTETRRRSGSIPEPDTGRSEGFRKRVGSLQKRARWLCRAQTLG
jgi:hypothetical protein